MALFLRGDVWYYEVRKPTRRVVKSTGFRKSERAKAEAVYRAVCIAMSVGTERSIVESMLDSIYSGRGPATDELPVSSIWSVYEDWARGKGKVVSAKETRDRRSVLRAFEDFAISHRVPTVERVDVALARAFMAGLGGANKTRRNKASALATIWEALAQMRPGIHNPWRAACPDDDGTGERRDAFTSDERARVLAAAEAIGHHWREVCLVGLYTGQRYGDCATLVWGDASAAASSRQPLEVGVVDLARGEIVLDPSKTRRHGTRLVIPMADALREALESMPRGSDGQYLFPEHAVRAAQRSAMDPPFRDILARAGVTEGYHDFHSFRHTLRTMLTEAGVSRDVASRFGGWTTARMGDHYDHGRDLDGMRAALARVCVK